MYKKRRGSGKREREGEREGLALGLPSRPILPSIGHLPVPGDVPVIVTPVLIRIMNLYYLS